MQRSPRRSAALALRAAIACAVAVLATAGRAGAVTLDAEFASSYSIATATLPTDLPTPIGSGVFKAGDSSKLLLAGASETNSGAIYQVSVTRGAGSHITSFAASSSLAISNAPQINAGLAYGPGGVLFFATSRGAGLGQVKPGSTTRDKAAPTPFFDTSSDTGLAFVPAGFSGAGNLIMTYTPASGVYQITLSPDGSGTYDIASGTLISAGLGGGLEALAYVAAGNPGFGVNSVLMAEYPGRYLAFQVDAAGAPIASTQRVFATTGGTTQALGFAVDPVTLDLLMFDFTGRSVSIVSGFMTAVPLPLPEPGTLTLAAAAGLALAGARRRSRPGR